MASHSWYFDNENSEQMVDQLNRILHDKDLVAGLRSKALERLKDFSWQKTVKQHIDVYEKVVSK